MRTPHPRRSTTHDLHDLPLYVVYRFDRATSIGDQRNTLIIVFTYSNLVVTATILAMAVLVSGNLIVHDMCKGETSVRSLLGAIHRVIEISWLKFRTDQGCHFVAT